MYGIPYVPFVSNPSAAADSSTPLSTLVSPAYLIGLLEAERMSSRAVVNALNSS